MNTVTLEKAGNRVTGNISNPGVSFASARRPFVPSAPTTFNMLDGAGNVYASQYVAVDGSGNIYSIPTTILDGDGNSYVMV